MKKGADAELLMKERYAASERGFVEIVVWRVPRPVPGRGHLFKYRLALVVDGDCVIRYDNELGKGDHKHLGSREHTYEFKDLETLQIDFWTDVERRLKQ